MIKKIRANNVQNIPRDHIPYKNHWGLFVWTRPELAPDLDWPGIKAPKWANHAKFLEGNWCWVA
jgi:hypothetical protein